MNKIIREIISNTGRGVAATICAISVLTFSGIKNIPLLILLSALAGTAGNLGFTWLFGRIADGIQKRNRPHPGDTVIAFSNYPVEDSGLFPAGGKGLALAKMLQAGYPVPDGCVLTPAAFNQNNLTPEAWKQVKSQLIRLRGGKDRTFAVRSSALQEDSARASFAGEFESVLDVRTDEEVREAVKTVLQSGRSERVESYTKAHGLDEGEQSVAVVIQKMIHPDYAGVIFTADPLTGNLGQMTGNFVAGTGEKLVSGQVTASTFAIDRPKGTYHGPAELEKIAKTLHRLAHKIEIEMGCPQDIEWAAAGKKVFILQARPITTLNGYDPVNAVWNETLKGNFLWSATNLMEASPDVLTPLTASMLHYLDQHGGPALTVKNYPLNGIIAGRFYANISVQVSAFSRMFKGDARRTYREMAGWWGDIPEGMEIPILPLTGEDWFKGVLPMLMRSTGQFGKYRKQAPKFLAQNRSVCKELREKVRQETTKTGLAKIWQEDVFPGYRDALFYIVAAGSDVQVRLERELKTLVGDEDANALLSNLGGSSSRLESLGPLSGLGKVLRGEMSREEYLDRYGYRGVNEGECAWPRPSEDPAWLDRQLAEWARSPVDVDALIARQHAAYEAAWGRFCKKYPEKVHSMQKKLAQACKAAQQREIMRSEGTRGMTVLRTFALRAGELLGVGEDVFYLTIDEILEALESETEPAAFRYLPARKETYLRYKALPPYPAFICGRFDPFTWAADPNHRSDYFDSRLQSASSAIVSEKDTAIIHGFAGALGIAEGIVRRLNSVDQSSQFQASEVLVTTMTNIGWTPLFPRAAAIVTDLGAPLSHAAIVAREMGIPAVVGCSDATMRLKTGDRVRVDGGKGLVEIL